MIDLITFGVTVGVPTLIGAARRRGKKAASPKKQAMSQQGADELITVILPTINHDK